MNEATLQIKEMVGRVVQLNNEEDLKEVCCDFKANLMSVADSGSFKVVLCDLDSSGYALCIEKSSGAGTIYKVEFECLNEAVCFFTNEFLAEEHKSFTSKTSMRLEKMKGYVDGGYWLHFENDTIKH